MESAEGTIPCVPGRVLLFVVITAGITTFSCHYHAIPCRSTYWESWDFALCMRLTMFIQKLYVVCEHRMMETDLCNEVFVHLILLITIFLKIRF